MPEGDTIHYAAHRIRPILLGGVPDEILTPHPRFGADRWPQRLGGREVASVDAPRQAPVPALRRRPDDALTPADDRLVGHLRGRRALAPSPRRAWLILRARGHEVVQFDGPVLELLTESRTRFDLRLLPSGPTSARRRSTPSATCDACGRTTRRGPSATPCSTSAPWPASATSGRARRAGRRRSTRAVRPDASPTTRRAPWSTSCTRGWSTRHAPGPADETRASIGATAGRADGAGRRSAPAGSATTTARHTGARDASSDAPIRGAGDPSRATRRPQGRARTRPRQHGAELRRGAAARRRHDRVRRAARARGRQRAARARPRLHGRAGAHAAQPVRGARAPRRTSVRRRRARRRPEAAGVRGGASSTRSATTACSNAR